jgi:CheY-like chemotaxis protein
MLCELLSSAGYDVRSAGDGAHALSVAETFHPDVAVVDIGLPVMDGYELAERLRAHDQPAPYLIAVTGYGQTSDRERSRAAGFSLHLVKPVEAEQVLDAVASRPQ